MPAARMHVKPDRIDLVSGSGCSFIAFGSLFVLVGFFALSFVIGSEEHAAHHSVFERVLGGAVGLAFMLAGSLFALSKNGITIDRCDSVVSKWSGALSFRFVTDTIPFNELSRFAIERHGPYTYAVVVQGGTTTETLFTSHSHDTARERAEKIGTILPLELHDEVEST